MVDQASDVWGFLEPASALAKQGIPHAITMTKDEVKCGRSAVRSDRQIVTQQAFPQASAVHFIIYRGEDQVTILDHSTNGTYVDGVRLEKGKRFPLHDGGHVSLAANPITAKDQNKNMAVPEYIFRLGTPELAPAPLQDAANTANRGRGQASTMHAASAGSPSSILGKRPTAHPSPKPSDPHKPEGGAAEREGGGGAAVSNRGGSPQQHEGAPAVPPSSNCPFDSPNKSNDGASEQTVDGARGKRARKEAGEEAAPGLGGRGGATPSSACAASAVVEGGSCSDAAPASLAAVLARLPPAPPPQASESELLGNMRATNQHLRQLLEQSAVAQTAMQRERGAAAEAHAAALRQAEDRRATELAALAAAKEAGEAQAGAQLAAAEAQIQALQAEAATAKERAAGAEASLGEEQGAVARLRAAEEARREEAGQLAAAVQAERAAAAEAQRRAQQEREEAAAAGEQLRAAAHRAESECAQLRTRLQEERQAVAEERAAVQAMRAEARAQAAQLQQGAARLEQQQAALAEAHRAARDATAARDAARAEAALRVLESEEQRARAAVAEAAASASLEQGMLLSANVAAIDGIYPALAQAVAGIEQHLASARSLSFQGARPSAARPGAAAVPPAALPAPPPLAADPASPADLPTQQGGPEPAGSQLPSQGATQPLVAPQAPAPESAAPAPGACAAPAQLPAPPLEADAERATPLEPGEDPTPREGGPEGALGTADMPEEPQEDMQEDAAPPEDVPEEPQEDMPEEHMPDAEDAALRPLGRAQIDRPRSPVDDGETQALDESMGLAARAAAASALQRTCQLCTVRPQPGCHLCLQLARLDAELDANITAKVNSMDEDEDADSVPSPVSSLQPSPALPARSPPSVSRHAPAQGADSAEDINAAAGDAECGDEVAMDVVASQPGSRPLGHALAESGDPPPEAAIGASEEETAGRGVGGWLPGPAEGERAAEGAGGGVGGTQDSGVPDSGVAALEALAAAPPLPAVLEALPAVRGGSRTAALQAGAAEGAAEEAPGEALPAELNAVCWQYWAGGRLYGPWSLAEIQEFVAREQLSPEISLRHVSSPDVAIPLAAALDPRRPPAAGLDSDRELAGPEAEDATNVPETQEEEEDEEEDDEGEEEDEYYHVKEGDYSDEPESGAP